MKKFVYEDGYIYLKDLTDNEDETPEKYADQETMTIHRWMVSKMINKSFSYERRDCYLDKTTMVYFYFDENNHRVDFCCAAWLTQVLYETREQYWFFSDGDYDTAKQRFVREKRRKLNDIKFLLENMQKCGKFLEIWTEGQAMMNFTK